MIKHTIDVKDFENYYPEIEIAVSSGGKRLIAIVNLQSNNIIYRVGNGEKSYMQYFLQDAVEMYNRMPDR
jgi:hypothetical protein